MRIPVHMQRQAARLHFYDPAQSDRAISRTSGLSAGTVSELRHKLRACSKTWLELQDLDDDAWCATLGTQDRSKIQFKPVPDWGMGARTDATARCDHGAHLARVARDLPRGRGVLAVHGVVSAVEPAPARRDATQPPPGRQAIRGLRRPHGGDPRRRRRAVDLRADLCGGAGLLELHLHRGAGPARPRRIGCCAMCMPSKRWAACRSGWSATT